VLGRSHTRYLCARRLPCGTTIETNPMQRKSGANKMPRNDGIDVTVIDAIHTGIALGLGQTQTLTLWRELGGEVRDEEFARLWRQERAKFVEWRRQQAE
jgi:hypothetical protein